MKKEADVVKACCADFYQQAAVKFFLGDSFHPGGLKLTQELAQRVGIEANHTVLDIACGEGASCFFLAHTYGCEVAGTDASPSAIATAKEKAPLKGKTNFFVSDANSLPFSDKTFDAVITECAFSTFLDKEKSASEIYRVLKSGGQWGLSDMLVEQNRLPDSMKSILFQAGCVGSAKDFQGYAKQMQDAGFQIIEKKDAAWALDDLINRVEKRVLAAKLLIHNSNLPVTLQDLTAVEELITEGRGLLQQKIIGYGILIGKKSLS